MADRTKLKSFRTLLISVTILVISFLIIYEFQWLGNELEVPKTQARIRTAEVITDYRSIFSTGIMDSIQFRTSKVPYNKEPFIFFRYNSKYNLLVHRIKKSPSPTVLKIINQSTKDISTNSVYFGFEEGDIGFRCSSQKSKSPSNSFEFKLLNGQLIDSTFIGDTIKIYDIYNEGLYGYYEASEDADFYIKIIDKQSPATRMNVAVVESLDFFYIAVLYTRHSDVSTYNLPIQRLFTENVNHL